MGYIANAILYVLKHLGRIFVLMLIACLPLVLLKKDGLISERQYTDYGAKATLILIPAYFIVRTIIFTIKVIREPEDD